MFALAKRHHAWNARRASDPNGFLQNLAYLDAAYRSHARVEDRIRTGKDTGLARFPSKAHAINKAWMAAALLAATLLAWFAQLALDGPLAKAEPKTIRARRHRPTGAMRAACSTTSGSGRSTRSNMVLS